MREAEGKQSDYGCIKEDGVLGCVEVGRVPKRPWFPFPTVDTRSTSLFEAQSLCAAQDARIQWMLDHDLIKIQFQNSYTRAIAALGRALRTDPQLPCRQMVPLTLLPAGIWGNCSSPAACGSGRGRVAADGETDGLGSGRRDSQFVVFVRDEFGRGLEGKSVYLWVKPDLPDGIDDRVLFQPGSPRVGVRAAPLRELGGGAYLFDDRAGEGGEGGADGSPFLWAQATEILPDGKDGRYGQKGDRCGNCSNAPFEYTFVVDGVRAPAVALPFRRVALADGRVLLDIARAACGQEPGELRSSQPVNLSATPPPSDEPRLPNATAVEEALPPVDREGGMCAQVLIRTPLPAEVLSNRALGQVTGQVVNASGHPIHSAEVCLGWDDPADGLDEQSAALAELRALNPLASGAYGPCLQNCTRKGNITDAVALLNLCVATCREGAVAASKGFCNVTDKLGFTTISGSPLPYPIGYLRWRLFVRDPYDDDSFPTNVSTAMWTWQQCVRQRLGRRVAHPPDPLGTSSRGRGGASAVCRSADLWSRVTRGTTMRFVNLSSLTEENQPSPVPFPPDPLLVRPGETASLDVHTTYSATGIGVAASATRATVVAVPSLAVARRRHGMWPADSSPTSSAEPASAASYLLPAASWSLNNVLLTSSRENRVCIGGLGCNKAKALTDPGFSRIDLRTDATFIGRYVICVDAHVVCFAVWSLPLLPVDTCPAPGDIAPARVYGMARLPALTPCASSATGAIRILLDPIAQIAPEFWSEGGGQAAASIVVGASFGAMRVQLLGAAGDALTNFRVRAHVVEGAGKSWEKSGRYARAICLL